jgi:hypothetical protein
MLGSLEELCTGKGITHTYMDRINALYTQLDQCDYQGELLISFDVEHVASKFRLFKLCVEYLTYICGLFKV